MNQMCPQCMKYNIDSLHHCPIDYGVSEDYIIKRNVLEYLTIMSSQINHIEEMLERIVNDSGTKIATIKNAKSVSQKSSKKIEEKT